MARHATHNLAVRVPPPPRVRTRAHCRWYRLGRPWRRYAREGFLHNGGRRVGDGVPGGSGGELRGGRLVPGYRSFRICPNLSLRPVIDGGSPRAYRASGLALAVRPAGPVEAPGSTTRRRRLPRSGMRSGMRSTVETAGGADPDNARRSGLMAVIFTRTVIGVLGANGTAWSCLCGAASWALRSGPLRPVAVKPCAAARRAAGLPPEGRGESCRSATATPPATLAAYHRSSGALPPVARVAGSDTVGVARRRCALDDREENPHSTVWRYGSRRIAPA